jgi:hypothetical protein
MELAPAVRVNAIVPGPVLPPPGYTEQQVAAAARKTLWDGGGQPKTWRKP